MFESPAVRGVSLVLVLAAQVGLLVLGGTAVVGQGTDPYPSEYALALDYDAYVGSEVSVEGEVVSTDPVVIARQFQYQEIRLTIRDVDTEVTTGETLFVFGVAEPDHTIRAERAYTVSGSGQLYAYVVSALAGAWVLARLVRGWRVDPAAWGLTPREGRDG